MQLRSILRLLLTLAAMLVFFQIENVAAEEMHMSENVFTWPDGQKMAISLSYDDALDSQLDNAIPSLNKHGLAASFYLTLASSTVRHRLEEWRAAAMNGHELGNHTIFHPCSAALPDRGWVPSYYNIDDYVIQEIVDEVTVANSFLHAIDGRSERTLTAPCGELWSVVKTTYLPCESCSSQSKDLNPVTRPLRIGGGRLAFPVRK
jgi:peptidoglycan/xylan/chitin deacetylase (PgdA/CDA1 family)